VRSAEWGRQSEFPLTLPSPRGEGKPPPALGLILVSNQFHGWIPPCGGSRKSESSVLWPLALRKRGEGREERVGEKLKTETLKC
jgi:hypothetical protein